MIESPIRLENPPKQKKWRGIFLSKMALYGEAWYIMLAINYPA
jgi:hypothetical protein